MSTRPWWEAAFGEQYDTVYAHRSDDAAQAEVAGLLPRLQAAGGVVCDACCGNGRHLAAMREAGLTTIGFDYSAHLLRTVRQRRQAKGRVARADIRNLPLAPHSFDAVTLLFTAFGYFDDASNQDVLSEVRDLIRPGGWLVLDLPDVDYLRAHLISESERTAADGTQIVERRRFDGSAVVKDVLLRRNDTVVGTWQERVRLYQPVELAACVAQAGMQVVDVWPSLRSATQDDHRHVAWVTIPV